MLRTVAKQAAELAVEKMEGIEVILNDDDLTDIQVHRRITQVRSDRQDIYIRIGKSSEVIVL